MGTTSGWPTGGGEHRETSTGPAPHLNAVHGDRRRGSVHTSESGFPDMVWNRVLAGAVGEVPPVVSAGLTWPHPGECWAA